MKLPRNNSSRSQRFLSDKQGNALTGFTLVEMMVTISITLLISAMLLVYNRSNEKQIVLFRDQAVLVGFLNRAKTLAIEKFNKDSRVCAFGLYFPSNDPRKIILFGDLEPPDSPPIFGCRTANGQLNTNLRYDPGEEIQSYTLDARLRFVNIPNELAILFIPPGLNIQSSAPLPVVIKIETVDGTNSASMTVGEAGQIIVH